MRLHVQWVHAMIANKSCAGRFRSQSLAAVTNSSRELTFNYGVDSNDWVDWDINLWPFGISSLLMSDTNRIDEEGMRILRGISQKPET